MKELAQRERGIITLSNAMESEVGHDASKRVYHTVISSVTAVVDA